MRIQTILCVILLTAAPMLLGAGLTDKKVAADEKQVTGKNQEPAKKEGTGNPVVSLEGDSTVVYCPTCADSTIRVGVAPEGTFRVKLKPDVEQPLITEVAFEKMRDGSIQKAFEPTWVFSENGTPRSIEVKVTSGILKPGTYALSLSLQPRSAPAAPRLKLQVIYPEADLEVPAKLTVYREKPLWGDPQDDKPPLDLRETKSLAPLTGLSVQARTAVSGSRPVSGTLEVKLKGGRIEAGSILKNVSYELTGDFPLGTTTGSLRFFANELKEPKTLDFEVKTVLTKWWLLIAIFLGLAASFVTRNVLTRKIQLTEARIAGRKVAEQIQADITRYADETLKENLSAALTTLCTELAKADVGNINTATKTASDNHKTAIEDFKTRLNAEDQNCNSWGTALQHRDLPPRIEEIRMKLETDLQDAGKLLKMGDPTGVHNILHNILSGSANNGSEHKERTIGSELKERTIAYQKAARSLLDGLGSVEEGLPASVQSRYVDRMKGEPTKLDSVSVASAVGKPEDFGVIFENLAVEYEVTRGRLTELADSFQYLWGKKITGVLKMIDPPLFDGLEKTVSGFIQNIPSYADDPAAAYENPSKTLHALQSTWEEFFKAYTNDQSVLDLVRKREG